MSPNVLLELSGGFMRPLNAADVCEGYVSGINDPEVNKYLAVRYTTQTLQSITDFVVGDEESDNAVLWGIWLASSRELCGTVRLHAIEHRHGTANIGVCLFDKAAWGQRLGSKAIVVATRWAFNWLGLRWIEAGAYASNFASQKTFLSADYEWIYDVHGKYLLEGKPETVRVFAAKNEYFGKSAGTGGFA
jgi:ribosomal-protein-alanine N-acetyltransferase